MYKKNFHNFVSADGGRNYNSLINFEQFTYTVYLSIDGIPQPDYIQYDRGRAVAQQASQNLAPQ